MLKKQKLKLINWNNVYLRPEQKKARTKAYDYNKTEGNPSAEKEEEEGRRM